MGKNQITAGTNYSYLGTLWGLPQSAKLEIQTVDKLSDFLWYLASGDTNFGVLPPPPALRRVGGPTNPPPVAQPHVSTNATLFRPLVNDLLRSEAYLELDGSTSRAPALALAVKLDDAHAAQWATNLAAALSAATGRQPEPLRLKAPRSASKHSEWQFRLSAPSTLNPLSNSQPSTLDFRLSKSPIRPSTLLLTRAGDWTVLSLGGETNLLAAELLSRIRERHTPVDFPPTNLWLEAEIDLPGVARALSLGWLLPANSPRLSLAAGGEGEFVRSRGDLVFPKPLGLELEPWNIPTNLVQQKLTSFTAIRGFRSWLAALPAWKDLQLGGTPDQAFFWGRGPLPYLSYFAVPWPGASNAVSRLSDYLLQEGNTWAAAHVVGSFHLETNDHGVFLSHCLPPLAPFVRPETSAGSDLVFGCLVKIPPGEDEPVPQALLNEITSRTKLVYYDWELTGLRAEQWRDVAQELRLISFRRRVPPDCAALEWLKALKPRLGNAVTMVTQTAPDQLTFTRKSHIGLTGIELHVLVDWLESPRFPAAFHSQVAHVILPPLQSHEPKVQVFSIPATSVEQEKKPKP